MFKHNESFKTPQLPTINYKKGIIKRIAEKDSNDYKAFERRKGNNLTNLNVRKILINLIQSYRFYFN